MAWKHNKKWRETHSEEYKAYMVEYGKKYRLEDKLKVIAHYSNGKNECACCGENLIEFLTINHLGGGGNKHRKEIGGHLYRWLIKHNYPKGYDVMCMNCNFSLGKFGYCPHKEVIR